MSKVVIIGAGSSGIVSAIYASKNNEVILIDKNEDIGKKLLITGNGRCNYFNEDQSLSHYHSTNEELLKEIINDENLNKVKKFFDSIGIVSQVKNGYYYPYSNQARSIKEMLLSEIKKSGVKFINNYNVENIKKENDKFIINDEIQCDKLILSTGGKSYSKTGSDGYGYELLKNFGHNINSVIPSLVSIKTNEKYLNKLNGVRCSSRVSLYENDILIKEEEGELQLTDYGLSGICIFNLSSYISRGLNQDKKEIVKVNFLPFLNTIDEFYSWIENRSKKLNKNIYAILETALNNKIIDVILSICNINRNSKYEDLNNNQIGLFAKNIIAHEFIVKETNSFDKAQTTLGGLTLKEINLKTMESLIVKNLYITGELIDIDGDCGGYNLTVAFLTGILAGENI